MREKNSRKTTDTAAPRTRTVKIADVIHHRIRVLSVQRRMPMQNFIEGLLLYGLKEKAFEKFEEKSEPQAA